MNVQAITTEYFDFDGRGCELIRWIHDAELYLPGSSEGFAPSPGSIVGAQYALISYTPSPDSMAEVPSAVVNEAWVIFHGLQVIQSVPEEVHSYWHRDFTDNNCRRSGVWEVRESVWLKTFTPRHLENHKHFIIEFYDDIVEVIARELIFGIGKFDIATVVKQDKRFAYAYLRHATSQEKLGNKEQACQSYQKYIHACPDSDSAEYARRCLRFIRTGSAERRLPP